MNSAGEAGFDFGFGSSVFWKCHPASGRTSPLTAKPGMVTSALVLQPRAEQRQVGLAKSLVGDAQRVGKAV